MKYSVIDVERLRTSSAEAWAIEAGIDVSGVSPIWNEERVRTYMANGTTAEELEAHVALLKQEERDLQRYA